MWEILTLGLPKYEIKTLGNLGLGLQKTNIRVRYVGIICIMQMFSWEPLKNCLVTAREVQFGGWHLQETLRGRVFML